MTLRYCSSNGKTGSATEPSDFPSGRKDDALDIPDRTLAGIAVFYATVYGSDGGAKRN